VYRLYSSHASDRLGVMLDAELSMREQVSWTAQSYFYTCADCVLSVGNLAAMSLPNWCLVSVMSYSQAFQPQHWRHCRRCYATARLVVDLRPRDHVQQALRGLHWLPIDKRIDYKLSVGPQSVDRADADVHRRHLQCPLPVTEHSALSRQRRLHRIRTHRN